MTRILHWTDLHLDSAPDNLTAAVAATGDFRPDVVLVGGDNGGPDGLARTAAAARSLGEDVAVAFVHGNHDLWFEPYDRVFAACPVPGLVPLERENLALPGCTVVGSYGHYDHSGGDPAIPDAVYETFRCGRLGWNDHHIDRLGRTNPEIAAELAEGFTERYQAAVQAGLPIVVVTHTLPFDALNAWPRNFYGAYGTNAAIGRVLVGHPPALVLCGHTHRHVRRDDFGFPTVNTGSDYAHVRVTTAVLEESGMVSLETSP